MKSSIFFSIFLFFCVGGIQAQDTITPVKKPLIMTSKLTVSGNCAMCKKRIETAAKIEGVQTAEWDIDTKILTITFDINKIKPRHVHAAVAAAGHDTDKVRADDAVYEKLHTCCQYPRLN